MSGRKYTKAQVDASISKLLEDYHNACQKIQDIENHVVVWQSCGEKSGSLNAVIRKIAEQVETVQKWLNMMKDTLLPNILRAIGMEYVQRMQKEIEKGMEVLLRTKEQYEVGQEAMALKMRLLVLKKSIEQHKDRVVYWCRHEVESFEKQWQAELSEVEVSIANLKESKDLKYTIDRLEKAWNKLFNQVEGCEQKHARRLYMIEAVKEVCKEMGFMVKSQSMDDPNQPIHLEIDTFAFGIMAFDFLLSEEVRSFSNYSPSQCEGCYIDIMEKLKQLGVMTDFRHEDNDRPMRTKAELREIITSKEQETEA